MSAIPVDTAMFAAVGATGGGSLYKALGLRRERRDPATHAVVLGLACLSVAALLYTPSVYFFLDARLHANNVCELLGHAFVLVAGWNGQRLLLHLTGQATPPNTRARGAVAAAAIGGIAAFFAVDPRPIETTDFTVLINGHWANTAYWLALIACALFQLADIARLSRRCARLAGRDWIGLGLAIVALGCVVGMLFFTDPLAYVFFRLAGDSPPQVLDAVGRGLCVMSLSMVAVGAAMPAWAKYLARDPSSFVRARRAYRQLEPLWSALRTAAPQIALDQRTRNAEVRLYRRVIEIRDGILTVRAELDDHARAGVTACARRRGLDDVGVDAAIEAAALHRGMLGLAGTPGSVVANADVIGGSNLDDEVAWLGCVAQGYAHIAEHRCGVRAAGL